MDIKDFDTISAHVSRVGHRRRPVRKSGAPSLGAAVLGVVCVVGVFALLGLLYSFG
jgi:hypothetical protein